MSFNLEVVNTGVSANDGLGDPLRTAFSKSHNNDVTLSGEIIDLSGDIGGRLHNTGNSLQGQFNDLSGNLQTEYENADDVLSGNLQTQITTLQGQTGDYLTEESSSGTYSTQFNVTAAGGAYFLSEITAGSHTTTSQVQKLEINLQRGNTYKFTTDSSTNGHPFIFVTEGNGGAYTYEYTSGVTNSRAQNGGILYFRVPQSAPSSLNYACGVHGNFGARVNIHDKAPVVTNRRYNSLVSGETINITGSLQTSIRDGHYNVTFQEVHFGTGTSFSSSPYSYLTGAGSYLISYPINNIGSPYDTDKNYNLSTSGDNILAITRTSNPKNVAVSGAGSTSTDLDGLSYHYLDVHLREY